MRPELLLLRSPIPERPEIHQIVLRPALPPVRGAGGAPGAAASAARALRARGPSLRPDPIDRRLRDGDVVEGKSLTLKAVHAPGHTPGHCLYLEPASGVLLTGDHLMGNAVPYTDNFLVEGPPDPQDPLRRPPRFRGLPLYMAGLRALRRQHFRALLPAHGGVIERASRAIEDAILFYEVRIQRVERALRGLAGAQGWATAWQVWERLFPKADPVTQMRTRMYMVIGALDLLEEQGAVATRWRSDGALEHRGSG